MFRTSIRESGPLIRGSLSGRESVSACPVWESGALIRYVLLSGWGLRELVSDFSPGRASRSRGNDFVVCKLSARLGVVFGALREDPFLKKHKEF